MTKKIILFNGCPSSGKDWASKYLLNKYQDNNKGLIFKTDKFARVLKERTHALYGFSWKPHDFYELVKEVPTEDFMGLTPRQAYINVSEIYFKQVHGKDVFGKILAKEIDKYKWDVLFITDSGFIEEAEVLINKYGEENVILVRIYRDGYSFKGDSRNYLDFSNRICSTNITNDGTKNYEKVLDNLLEDLSIL